MSTINREKLIQQLESVQPGLAEREVLEQSSCFVFESGRVITFNDEIACSNKCDLGFSGAVRAKPLLSILHKLTEEDLEIDWAEGECRIQGNRKEMGILGEKEIVLPVDKLERPTKWHELPEAFIEAIGLVQHCTSTDEAQFVLTCVHLTPTYLEACDNTQLTRVKVATPVKQNILVRRDSVKHVVTLGMTEMAETESWVHFRNPVGLTLSCRRFVDEYYDISGLMKFTGEKIVLPKGLTNAADKAAVFAESIEGANVQVELRPGKLRLTGQGVAGWYRETRKVAYEGQALSFLVSPTLLMEITKKYTDAEISPTRLRVRGPNWQYVACLGTTEGKNGQAASEPADPE